MRAQQLSVGEIARAHSHHQPLLAKCPLISSNIRRITLCCSSRQRNFNSVVASSRFVGQVEADETTNRLTVVDPDFYTFVRHAKALLRHVILSMQADRRTPAASPFSSTAEAARLRANALFAQAGLLPAVTFAVNA